MNNKLSSTSDRLKEIMKERKLKQVDILKLSEPFQKKYNIKLSKSNISEYVNGKSNPDQHKVYLLAKTLDVSEPWLMGYDVPIKLEWSNYDENTDIDKIKLDIKICEVYGMKSGILLNNYEQLDDDGKEKLIDISFDMIKESDHIYTTVYTIEKVAAGNGYGYTNESSVPYYTDRTDLYNYDFATVVKGDSMIPKFNDGDIILVKTGYDNVNGDIYVIDYDGKSYVKKLYNDGDRFRLVSINKKYENIIIDIPTDDSIYFNIVGKVVDSFTPIEI